MCNLKVELLKTVIANTIVLFWYFAVSKATNRHIGNVSTFTKEAFLEQHPRFALYLRGFADDDYSKRHFFRRSQFSEYQFIRLLNTRIRACAVGMTKELDSPDGAIRVYVDDKSWQGDVLELMQKAESIFILVNDRPSCVWEIEQSANMKDKTTYIVTNTKRYLNVRGELHGIIGFPDIKDSILKKRFFLKSEGTGYKTSTFDNNITGYNLIARGYKKRIFRQDSIRRRLRIGWGILIGFPYMIVTATLLFNLSFDPYRFCEVFYGSLFNLSVFIMVLIFLIYLYLFLPNYYQLVITLWHKHRLRQIRR